MKPRSLLIAFAALIAVVFAGAYLGSPWLTAWDIVRAARQRDVAALQAHVDMPAVRASLKSQLDDRIEHEIEARAARHDPLAELGALFGAALVDKAVDTVVTPDMLAEAVRTGHAPTPSKAASRAAAGGDDPSAEPAGKPPRVKIGVALTSLDSFEMRLRDKDDPDSRLTLVMHRRGLFDWKVDQVILPRFETPSRG